MGSLSEYSIRQATIKDGDALFDLMTKVNYIATFYGNLSESDAKTKVMQDFLTRRAGVTVLLLLHNKVVVGYSIFKPYVDMPSYYPIEKKDVYIYSLGIAINPSFQGMGLGLYLKNETEAFAKQKVFFGMYTSVAVTNTKSIALQKKCGYVCVANAVKTHSERVEHIFKKDFS